MNWAITESSRSFDWQDKSQSPPLQGMNLIFSLTCMNTRFWTASGFALHFYCTILYNLMPIIITFSSFHVVLNNENTDIIHFEK